MKERKILAPEGTLLSWSASHPPTHWRDPSSFPCCKIQMHYSEFKVMGFAEETIFVQKSE